MHVEALPHLHRTLQVLRNAGVKAGVAINPSTPVVALEEIAAEVDQVLLMSVNPGFGGQTFIPRSESKIRAVRALLDAAGNDAPVSVDGGVDHSNARRIVAAGAGILIAGQAIFGSGDAERATRELRAQADGRGMRRGSMAKVRRADAVSVSHVRVRYAETDKMGVVYYANYFVWFEVARADLLRSLGWSYREMELAGISLPVIEAQCQYHRARATTTSSR